MAFKVKDVLIIDATVIVGLLILLSFQSISSSFIETESSDFMREWYTVERQYSSTLELLEDCKMLNDDRAAYETHILKGDNLSSEMEDEIKKSCSKWFVESLEQERHLMKLNHWGYNFNYLQQRDGDGIIYTSGTQSEGGVADYFDTELNEWVYTEARFANFNPEFDTERSDYFRNIVTGPMHIHIMNFIMILPFVFSGAFASLNVLYARWKGQDEETNTATNWSVGAMGIGFVVLMIGMAVILYAFYQIDEPFLDRTPEYAWNCDPTEAERLATKGDMGECVLLPLDMPPTTRNVP
tara:strand:- start:1 stop:891 length:891 start_codon:yes stop_codon:yes gene_type:complete